ncbi:methyltransferase domain-containing protein [Candidatus Bathyarchaeota archaeon]|nr:methyltransferase domain-containing protein [Candidatus Bathyarchaeota archaeon]
MGKTAQKRLIRKLELELFLSQMEFQPSPKASLEQYTVSEAIAAKMLYLAAYTNGDIVGKKVLDLGCGTGRLALAASYLGAQFVVGVDIDKTAIKTASENSKKAGFKTDVQWVLADIGAVTGSFDTVLQNPPFGVQKRTADRKFLEKALEVSDVVYSLHNHPSTDKKLIQRLRSDSGGLLQVEPSPFIARFVESHSGVVKAVYAMLMTIPRMFDFHTKLKHDFVVDLYLIKKRKL